MRTVIVDYLRSGGSLMSSTHTTTTGHALSQDSWIDAHYQSSREEYEAALRSVGIQPGWRVLDAGCGSGGFLPRMCELVGGHGHVIALDLAPEHIAKVETLLRDSRLANLESRQGSIL